MCEVAAAVQRQPKDGVTRLEQSVHHRRVGLRTGMWLDVGELRSEQRLDPIDRDLLDDVDVLAAAVVAPTRIALGVLVRQHGTLRLHHRQRCVIL
jgi:hypothetical protein